MGILARVPLASGLLTGKMKASTAFASDDHRHFNRAKRSIGGRRLLVFPRRVSAVERLDPCPGTTMAQLALRWILMGGCGDVHHPGASGLHRSRTTLRLPICRRFPMRRWPRSRPSTRGTSGSTFITIGSRWMNACGCPPVSGAHRAPASEPGGAGTKRDVILAAALAGRDQAYVPWSMGHG